MKREGAQLEEKAECERRERGLDIGKASAQQEVLAAPLCSMCGGGSRRRRFIMQHACMGEASAFSHLKPQFGFNDMAENNKPKGYP